MTIGVKSKRGLIQHQKKKHMSLFPEKYAAVQRIMEKGGEAKQVTINRSSLGKGTVTKDYTVGKIRKRPRPTVRKITEKEMVRRFKLMKEMNSAGLPVAKPIRVIIDGKKILWQEQEIQGRTYEEIRKEYFEKELFKSKKNQEKFQKMLEIYNKSVDSIIDYAQSRMKIGEMGNIPDLFYGNAIWNGKQFVFTDLFMFRKKKF